jgi:hypothetical protein
MERPRRAPSLPEHVALDLAASWLSPAGGSGIGMADDAATAEMLLAWLDPPARGVAIGGKSTDICDRTLVLSSRAGALPTLAECRGRLAIIVPGPGAPLLDRLRRVRNPRRFASVPRIPGAARCGIGRFATIAAVVARRATTLAGRLDLADRWELTYRASLAPGPVSPFSDLVVILRATET